MGQLEVEPAPSTADSHVECLLCLQVGQSSTPLGQIPQFVGAGEVENLGQGSRCAIL